MSRSTSLSITAVLVVLGIAGAACHGAVPAESAPSAATDGAGDRGAASVPVVAAADAGGAPLASDAGAMAVPDASAPPPPAAVLVTPTLSITRRRPCWSVSVEGLPAISTDGQHVVLVEANDTAATCAEPRLLIYDTASGRPASNSPLLADAFAGDDPPSGANAKAVARANATLGTYTFRAFDTGALPERGPDLVETPEMSLPGAHLAFEMREANGERWLSKLHATTPSGPLFDKDVSAWRHEKAPGGAGATLIGARLVRIDVAARVLLLVGVYMNVNAYLPATQMVHVTRF
jgi:hypothetical protein